MVSHCSQDKVSHELVSLWPHFLLLTDRYLSSASLINKEFFRSGFPWLWACSCYCKSLCLGTPTPHHLPPPHTCRIFTYPSRLRLSPLVWSFLWPLNTLNYSLLCTPCVSHGTFSCLVSMTLVYMCVSLYNCEFPEKKTNLNLSQHLAPCQGHCKNLIVTTNSFLGITTCQVLFWAFCADSYFILSALWDRFYFPPLYRWGHVACIIIKCTENALDEYLLNER